MSGQSPIDVLREALPSLDGHEENCPCSVGCAHAALDKVEALVDAAGPMANLPWPLSSDERQEWIVNQNRLRAALALFTEQTDE